MSIQQMLLGGSGVTGYNLERSVRFRASASAYLNRTPASTTNQKTFTLSTWIKRGALNSAGNIGIFVAGTGASEQNRFMFVNDTLWFDRVTGGGVAWYLQTSQVFRDPSAWYHIVLAVDTTQATASNRVKFYVNGSLVTAFANAGYPAQNDSTYVNLNGATHRLGIGDLTPTYYFDGYRAETISVDGQALTPASFGETNALTGVWQPIAYTGTYGTNGFYLPFTDNSALTTSSNVGLGKDFSGNGNYWTTNNISITSGVTYDSMTDVPTLTSATAANYAVLNPLQLAGSGTGSITNGNMTLTSPGGDGTGAQTAGSIAVTSGKYYFEGTFSTLTSASGYLCFGVQNGTVVISGLSGSSRSGTNTWWISDDGNYRANGGTITASGLGAFSAGNVAMIAIDASTGKGWIGKNGTWVGDPAAGTGNTFSSLPALIAPFAQAIRNTTTSSVINANFGQRPFSYTPPTGFVALNAFNLPAATVVDGSEAFNIALDTGANIKTATEALFSGSQFFEWIKDRANLNNHQLLNSVRGLTAVTQSNTQSAETTYTAPSGSSIGYAWKANSSSVSNTDGTITTTVSANPSAGFSIVNYNGNATAGATIGHGLGVAPSFGIFKNLAGVTDWQVYHSALGGNSALFLNSDVAANTSSLWWNNTAPTSSVMTLGSISYVNASAQGIIGLLWSEIAGYSKFGSYSTNASTNGPFIYTGFRARWILLKASTTVSGGNWVVIDTANNTYNVVKNWLFPNANSSLQNYIEICDINSNGFKIRTTWDTVNASGATMLYAAFAENPFKYSLAR